MNSEEHEDYIDNLSELDEANFVDLLKASKQKMQSTQALQQQQELKRKQKIEADTNLSVEEFDRFAAFAQANGLAFGIRPISRSTKRLFEQGYVGKGMDIKAKSADQKAVEGRILSSQKFSKIGSKNNADVAATIAKYQEKTDKKLKDDVQIIADLKKLSPKKLAAKKAKNPNLFDNIVQEVAYKVDGCQVFGLAAKDSNLPVKDKNNEMVFVYEKNGIIYDAATKKPHSLSKNALQELGKLEPINMLGYADLSIGNHGLEIGEPRPITADYDQLTFGTRLADGVNEKITGLDHNQYAGYSKSVGHSVTSVLADETKDNLAISHGAEVYNPCPEDINPTDKFVFILPEGDYRVAIGERGKRDKQGNLVGSPGMLDIINEYGSAERGNFQLDIRVNPGWGWQRAEDGKLSIRENRVNEQKLDLEIKNFEGSIKSAGQELIIEDDKYTHPKSAKDLQEILDLKNKINNLYVQKPSARLDKEGNFVDIDSLEVEMHQKIKQFAEMHDLNCPVRNAILNFNETALNSQIAKTQTKAEMADKEASWPTIEQVASMPPININNIEVYDDLTPASPVVDSLASELGKVESKGRNNLRKKMHNPISSIAEEKEFSQEPLVEDLSPAFKSEDNLSSILAEREPSEQAVIKSKLKEIRNHLVSASEKKPVGTSKKTTMHKDKNSKGRTL